MLDQLWDGRRAHARTRKFFVLRPESARRSNPQLRGYQTHSFARPEWDDERIRRWARKVGPSCAEVVERIFARVKLKEQAYNPALSVLRLSKKYGDERLEAACAHALPRLTSPRYRHIKAILDSNLDQEGPQDRDGAGDGQEKPAGHVRGADYYRELG